MPKSLKTILAVITAVLIVGVAYLLITDSSDQLNSAPAPERPTSSQVQITSEKPSKKGIYREYSADTVAKTHGQQILFFHAPWCPQCRQLDASIQAGTIPNNVTIVKVDYDSNQKLRQRYGVTIQTTLVLLDEDEKEVKKYVAYEEPNLEAIIKNLL